MFQRKTRTFKSAAHREELVLGETKRGLHCDFSLCVGHWSWNLLPKKPAREPRPQKLMFFFEEEHLALLSDCPCRAKIGRNRFGGSAYIGFLYPDSEDDAARAKQWAERFRRAQTLRAAAEDMQVFRKSVEA